MTIKSLPRALQIQSFFFSMTGLLLTSEFWSLVLQNCQVIERVQRGLVDRTGLKGRHLAVSSRCASFEWKNSRNIEDTCFCKKSLIWEEIKNFEFVNLTTAVSPICKKKLNWRETKKNSPGFRRKVWFERKLKNRVRTFEEKLDLTEYSRILVRTFEDSCFCAEDKLGLREFLKNNSSRNTSRQLFLQFARKAWFKRKF